MGLDMFLYKRTYVKNWDFMRPEERHTITVTGPHAAAIRPDDISYTAREVAYWRKANAVHRWFVHECQNGVDDCRQTYVPYDKLRELLHHCEAILTVATEGGDWQRVANERLPPVEGFLFGRTELDEHYLDDIRSTVQQLRVLLTEDEATGSVYYESSW